MKQKSKALLLFAGALVFLFCASEGVHGQQVVPFVEPENGREPLLNGRAPLLGGINQARAIDMYIFRICNDDGTCDPILDSLLSAAAPPRNARVQVLLEPCPGLGPNPCRRVGGATDGARMACQNLTRGGGVVKWANPGNVDLPITKQHAKTILLDPTDPASRKAFVMTLNLLPVHFTARRDYGVITNDATVVTNLSTVFNHDWGMDTPLAETDCVLPPARTGLGPRVVAPDEPLVISPDVNPLTLDTFAREQILGLIRRAATSLRLHMHRIDPNDLDIVPELQAAIARGVDLQVLLDPNEPDNTPVADTLNAEPPASERARFQTCLSMPTPTDPVAGRPHAKMFIADGRELFVGSHNLTATSLDNRREIGWITTDAGTIRRFQEVFDADWALTVSPPLLCP